MDKIHKPGPWSISIKWGTIAGIITVGIVILTSFNVDWLDYTSYEASLKSPWRIVNFAILVGAVIVAQILHRKKELGGYMGYGRAVGVATIVGMTIGVCMAIYLYILNGFWHPEFQQTYVEGNLAMMDKLGFKYTEKDIEGIQMSAKPAMRALTGFFSEVFTALVVGLITSIFIQKNDPNN